MAGCNTSMACSPQHLNLSLQVGCAPLEEIFTNGVFSSLAAAAAACPSLDECPPGSAAAINAMATLFAKMALAEYGRNKTATELGGNWENLGIQSTDSISIVRAGLDASQKARQELICVERSICTLAAQPLCTRTAAHNDLPPNTSKLFSEVILVGQQATGLQSDLGLAPACRWDAYQSLYWPGEYLATGAAWPRRCLWMHRPQYWRHPVM